MNWRRKSSSGCGRRQEMRERLIPSPSPCVPVLVGGDDEEPERVVVDVHALGQPCVRALLEMAGREYGCDQKGVLRIPCAAEDFRRALAADTTTAATGGTTIAADDKSALYVQIVVGAYVVDNTTVYTSS